MFDFNGFIWPERATDFGLFTQGHKFQAEKYLIHLEEYLQRDIKSVDTLRQAVKDFFYSIIRSPYSNPKSRILYVDGFQAEDWRFSDPYSQIDVDYSIRHYKDQLEGNRRKQVILCVAEAMLEALNDIGREYKKAGERFGCCLQLAGGATHFMDWSREIQSFPVNIPRLAQEEYSVWQRYPHIHFEYICAHKRLYSDLASAAKQVGNVSVGPWWHFFRRHKIAELIRDQISMGPISSIACGFTDARFVEMLAAKSQSMRLAITDVFTDLVEDEYSGLYKKVEESGKIIKKLLYSFPTQIHHIPV
jgi:hypothetical protein